MIQIIEAKKWGIKNGHYNNQQGWLDNTPSDILYITKGRKEYVILAEDYIKKQINELPNNSFMPQKISVVTKWLDQNNLEFQIID